MGKRPREYNRKWPLRYDRLYYTQSEKDAQESGGLENLPGIFSRNDIKGILYKLTEDSPLLSTYIPSIALFQFRKDRVCTNIDSIPIEQLAEYFDERVELFLIEKRKNPICAYVREHQKEVCDRFDFAAASCFLGKTISEIEDREKVIEIFRRRFSQAMEGCTFCSGPYADLAQYNPPIDNEHAELIYRCPCTLMTELLYPVIVKGQVFAVIISGQIIRSGATTSDVREQCKRTLTDFEDEILEKYTLDENAFLSITKHFRTWIPYFEANFNDRVENNCSCFIQATASEFFEAIHTKNEIKLINDRIDRSLLYLIERLSLKSIAFLCVHNEKRLIRDQHLKSEYELWPNGVRKTETYDIRAAIPLDNFVNDPLCICNGCLALVPTSSAAFPIKSLPDKSSPACILYCYQTSTDFADFALFIRWNSTLSNAEYKQALELLQHICSMISSEMVSDEYRNMWTRTSSTLLSVGHELGQQTLAAASRMEKLKNMWDSLSIVSNNLPESLVSVFQRAQDEFNFFYNDLQSIFEIVRMQSELVKSQTSSYMLRRTAFDMYKIIFFPLFSSQRILERQRKMRLCFEPSMNEGKQQAQIYGDSARLNQAVYNLVNNAFKYGYRGTKIYVDCQRDVTYPSKIDPKHCSHFIRVMNYGRDIPKEERVKIFDMGYRVQKDKGVATGMGYGLALVKQIAQEHGGDAWCETEFISQFNIPLMEECIRSWEDIRTEEMPATLIDDLKIEKQSRSSEFYDKIVYEPLRINQGGMAKSQLRKQIQQATYKVTFIMEIPSKIIQEAKPNATDK